MYHFQTAVKSGLKGFHKKNIKKQDSKIQLKSTVFYLVVKIKLKIPGFE